MLAIFKREFKSYFDTVIGFLFIAINIFMVGLYASYYNMEYGLCDLTYALYSPIVVVLIAVSILSMKVLSEEKKAKTDQLILTSPVSVTKIVVGKYLAMAAIYSIVVAFICLMPIFFKKFGEVPMKQNYTDILAFALFGYAALAVGMFISSITQTQVISAVLTFGVLFISYMMTNITSLLPDKLEKVGDVLNVFSMGSRFTDMIQGTLDLNAALYFVTVILLMNYLTVQSIQKRRYSISVKNMSLSSYNLIMAVAVTAIAVIINLASNQLPVRYTDIDVTSNQMYTLSDDTIDYIKNIDKDVTVYVMAEEDDADQTVLTTLNKMAELSDHMSIDFVDLTVTPKFYQKYTDSSSELANDDLVVDGGDLSKIISSEDLYEYQTDYTTYQQTQTGYDAEGQVLSALDYVMGGKQPKIYTIKGHSETTLETNFTDILNKANVESSELTLLNADKVPDDADAVIINNPQSDISSDDYDKLKTYIDGGGSLFINYANSTLENMNKLLSLYGVTVSDRYVIEGDSSHYSQSPLYVIPDVVSTDYTASLGDKYIFMPACSQMSTDDSDDAITITALLNTSDKAYAQKIDDSGKLSGKTVEGPFAIGVESERSKDGKTSKAIIYACPDMLTNSADEMVSKGNSELFKTNICAVVPQAGSKVTVASKSISDNYLTTTDSDVNTFRTIVVVLIPLISIIAGIVIWVSRRRR